MALSISWAMLNLGGFASTYAVSAMQGALGLSTVGSTPPILIGLLVVGAALSTAFGRARRGHRTAAAVDA